MTIHLDSKASNNCIVSKDEIYDGSQLERQDTTYAFIKNPSKNIFLDSKELNSKLAASLRKNDIELFFQCFQSVFYKYESLLDGHLNKIEISEDEDSTDIVWRYQGSLIYFSFNNESPLINYGAIIDQIRGRERQVYSGEISLGNVAKTNAISALLGNQLSRIIRG